jgi:glyoxylase-like metal-dependent hydrolase (beta-lactamase superfamily II)
MIVSPVRPASDFDRIASNIAIWHGYDSAVKAELYSTCLGTPDGTYLIDPIPFEREALSELIGSNCVAGIIVTNGNHHRASAKFAEKFSVPLFGRTEALRNKAARELKRVTDGDEISEELRAIGIEGAGDGEIALHYSADGGTFIIGDALINFEPYGFALLPGKYCSNEKEMRRSLRKLLAYKAERMLFAHGTPILSQGSERLRGLLESDP